MTDAVALTAKSIAGKAVVFKELTVAEIRAMSASSRSFDLINESLFEDLALPDIPTFTNLKLADIEALTPSEIQVVIDECKERNPHFFKMLARLNQGNKA